MARPKKNVDTEEKTEIKPKLNVKKNGKKRGRGKKKQLWGDKLLDLLEKNEYVESGGARHPKINGLLRLAHDVKQGIVACDTHVDNLNDGLMAVVTKIVRFGDGSTFSASADAQPNNMVMTIRNFPTAVADTRALSRAIRFALGISVTAAEEHEPEQKDTVVEETLAEENPAKKPINEAQILLLNLIRKAESLSDEDVTKILAKIERKPSSIEDLKTEEEATFVIKELRKVNQKNAKKVHA